MEMLNTLELSTLFDTVPNPVFIKDENLRFIFINKAYEKMFNVKKQNVIGKQVLDLDYLPESDKIFYQNEDSEMLEHGKTSHHIFNYAYQRKEIHTCLYWSAGFVQKNGKRGVIGVIVDINRQTRAIHQLRDQLRVTNLEKETVAKKSKIDFLTGLYTRLAFDDALRKLSSSATRGFSCIMLDIDHFKQVNDSFGHMAGDAVLEEVSSAMKQCSRKRDIVCRYGGEEFVILQPETGSSGALSLMARIQQNVKNTPLFTEKSITFSAGVACYPEQLTDENPNTIVLAADQALYHAKNNGKDRTCVYNPETDKRPLSEKSNFSIQYEIKTPSGFRQLPDCVTHGISGNSAQLETSERIANAKTIYMTIVKQKGSPNEELCRVHAQSLLEEQLDEKRFIYALNFTQLNQAQRAFIEQIL